MLRAGRLLACVGRPPTMADSGGGVVCSFCSCDTHEDVDAFGIGSRVNRVFTSMEYSNNIRIC